MQLSILASNEYLFAIAIPSQIINLIASFKKTVWSDLAEVRIINSQEEQRASGINDNYNATFPVALYLRNACLMDLEHFDQCKLFVL